MQNVESTHPASNAGHYFGTQHEYARMFEMIFGAHISQVVHTAALYSLSEHLAQGRNTPAEIAAVESLHADATFRLMRACAAIGLMTYDGHGKFAATPLLHTLHKDASHSLRGTALVIPAPGHWLPWGRLRDAIKTGAPQAVATLGRSLWEYLADASAEAAAFTDSMKGTSVVVNRDAARLVDTRSVRVAVDVGGASGTLLHALMEANPTLQGVVFDLPHVVPFATEAIRERGLHERCAVVAGDFFANPLPPADLFLLKLILHDWNDDAGLAILRNCRRAISAGGRILVVEQLIDAIGTPGFTPLLDLNMLVLFDGRERTLDEFKALFTAAGFRFASATPTSTPFVLIEAVAV
jgi:hypothetical protein